MQRTVKLILVLAILVIGATAAQALPTYVTQFDTTYPAATSIGNCALCHVNPAGGGTRTAYGNAFLAAGHSFTAIANQTSICTGYTNLQLINLLVSPGTGPCPAPAADTTPPTVTGFTVPTTASSMMIPITLFTATDNVGVTGYLITESATAPAATAAGWSATAPTSYHVMTSGSHTLYAWAKDAAGNVSAGVSASISITIPGATIVWSNPTTGNIGTWSMSGVNFLSSAIVGTAAAPWAVVGMGDFNKDGKSDILLRNTTTGDVDVWFMNGTTVTGGAYVGTAPTPWTVVGTGDFNKDGNIDILLVNTATGDVDVWFMNGTTVTGGAYIGTAPAPWTVVGTGDFNNDGNADILLRNTTTGDIDVWFMNGTTVTGGAYVGTAPTPWTVVGTGDFNNDGNADILLRNTTTGEVGAWFMNGATVTGGAAISHAAAPNLNIVGVQ